MGYLEDVAAEGEIDCMERINMADLECSFSPAVDADMLSKASKPHMSCVFCSFICELACGTDGVVFLCSFCAWPNDGRRDANASILSFLEAVGARVADTEADWRFDDASWPDDDGIERSNASKL